MRDQPGSQRSFWSRRFANLSLRRKLILVIAGASLLVVFLSMAGSFLFELSYFRNRLLEEYQSTARMLASNLEAAVAFEDVRDSREILSVLEERQFVVAAAVYSGNGDALATYRRTSSAPSTAKPPPPSTSNRLSGRSLTISQPVVVDGFTIGHVTLLADLGEMKPFLVARTGLILGLMAVAAAVAIALATSLGARISEPITELAITAQRISEHKDFSTRQQRVSDDETGRLVDAFNQMMAEIQSRELAILEAKEKAEASSRAKDDFLSVISHELRTPLNPIIGYVDILLGKRGTEDEERRQLQLVKRYAEHLQGLIDDVLDYSRIERGVFAISAEPIDYQSLCHDVVRLLRPQAEAKQLSLTCQHQTDAPARFILSDRLRLQQIFLNLLSNAIKFTDRGEVAARTAIKGAVGEQGALRVEVQDTGIGIAAAHRELVFQPFSQIDATLTRRNSGLGLGLAITRKIVAAMNGTLDFESEPGVGTTFRFTIPVTLLADHQGDEPSKTTPVAPDPSKAKRGKVLLVDDQAVNRELGESLLEGCGQHVVCARNGAEALEQVKKERFDLIIMDIKMPRMDGYEAARRIRAMETEGKRTPIIAMTAHVTANGSQECYDSGMDDFLPKPFSAEKLAIILDRWLH